MTFSWLKSEGRNWKHFEKEAQHSSQQPAASQHTGTQVSSQLGDSMLTIWLCHVSGRVWLCSYVLLKINNCNQTKACLYFSRYSSDEISTNPSQHISISLISRNENHEIWIRFDICVKRVYNHFGLIKCHSRSKSIVHTECRKSERCIHYLY